MKRITIKNPSDDKAIRDSFFAAREIALTIGINQMRRARTGKDEPFFGGNLNGEPVVLWKGEDNYLARKIGIIKHGIIEVGKNHKFYFKNVTIKNPLISFSNQYYNVLSKIQSLIDNGFYSEARHIIESHRRSLQEYEVRLLMEIVNDRQHNPYKSQAQRRKFHAMAERGEISQAVVDKYDRESEGLDLPERVKHNSSGAWLHNYAKKEWYYIVNGVHIGHIYFQDKLYSASVYPDGNIGVYKNILRAKAAVEKHAKELTHTPYRNPTYYVYFIHKPTNVTFEADHFIAENAKEALAQAKHEIPILVAERYPHIKASDVKVSLKFSGKEVSEYQYKHRVDNPRHLFHTLPIGAKFHTGNDKGSYLLYEKIDKSTGVVVEVHGNYQNRHIGTTNKFTANDVVYTLPVSNPRKRQTMRERCEEMIYGKDQEPTFSYYRDIENPTGYYDLSRDEIAELMNLWHLSKVPHNKRYDRMQWTTREFHKLHPEHGSTLIYKNLDRQLASTRGFFRNPSFQKHGHKTFSIKVDDYPSWRKQLFDIANRSIYAGTPQLGFDVQKRLMYGTKQALTSIIKTLIKNERDGAKEIWGTWRDDVYTDEQRKQFYALESLVK